MPYAQMQQGPPQQQGGMKNSSVQGGPPSPNQGFLGQMLRNWGA
jgi:hypothetical protein